MQPHTRALIEARARRIVGMIERDLDVEALQVATAELQATLAEAAREERLRD